MMATCPRTMWPVLASSIRLNIFVNNYGLRRYQVTNKRCVGTLCIKVEGVLRVR